MCPATPDELKYPYSVTSHLPVIFVFGSNLAGRHGKGAAFFALQNYGAEYGVGEGLTGSAYALPTKNRFLQSRDLNQIASSVFTFLKFATEHPEYVFKVTRIGCGLAGFSDEQIAPLFEDAPPNCGFDLTWSRWCLRSWADLGIK